MRKEKSGRQYRRRCLGRYSLLASSNAYLAQCTLFRDILILQHRHRSTIALFFVLAARREPDPDTPDKSQMQGLRRNGPLKIRYLVPTVPSFISDPLPHVIASKRCDTND